MGTKTENMEKTICDRCDNYFVSPSGTTETCMAQRRENSFLRANLTDAYVKERMEGNATNCKCFKKIISFIKTAQ